MVSWRLVGREAREFGTVRARLVGIGAQHVSRVLAVGDGSWTQGDEALGPWRFECQGAWLVLVVDGAGAMVCGEERADSELVVSFVRWLAAQVGAPLLRGTVLGRQRDIRFSDLMGRRSVLLDPGNCRAWSLLPSRRCA